MALYSIPGKDGRIETRRLPSGDIAVSGYGDVAHAHLATTICCNRAMDGAWEPNYSNWIVPKRNASRLAGRLAEYCNILAG